MSKEQSELNLSDGLVEWCKSHEIDARKLADDLGYGYQYAWRLLSKTSPVTVETVGRFVLAYGMEATQEFLDLSRGATDALACRQAEPVASVSMAV